MLISKIWVELISPDPVIVGILFMVKDIYNQTHLSIMAPDILGSYRILMIFAPLERGESPFSNGAKIIEIR